MPAPPEPVTLRDALRHAERALHDAHVQTARLDAELIAAHVLGRDRAWVLAHDDEALGESQHEQFNTFITRRAGREPLVHITGTREFYGLGMEVTPDVLTPRTETEQMVEWAIKHAPKNSSLIDVGTGSGAIAIAIAKHRPDLRVTATDISDKELAVARRNAANNSTPMTFIEADLWSGVTGSFDTVVTNLPYLPDNADLMPEVQKEPAVALFGGPDGLSLYKKVLQGLPAHLSPGGFLFTECDPWQHEDLIAAAAGVRLTPIEQGYFILGFQRSV